MDLTIQTRIICLIVMTLFSLWVSRKPLKNLKCHGFYRFFAFESIAVLLTLNVNMWFITPTAPHQLISWSFFIISVAVIMNSFLLLRLKGGHGERVDNIENMAFENTTHLVQDGIYKYIRHPMYSSLLFLTWGIFMKAPSFSGLIPAIIGSTALLLTGRTEEKENLEFFGNEYQGYIGRTKKFVPFVF